MKTLTGPSVIANLVTVPILSISTKGLVGLDADISSLSHPVESAWLPMYNKPTNSRRLLLYFASGGKGREAKDIGDVWMQANVQLKIGELYFYKCNFRLQTVKALNLFCVKLPGGGQLPYKNDVGARRKFYNPERYQNLN